MDRRPELRASDQDRQAAADRLLAAMQEGRLDLLEYDDRLARAYAAVTYADIDAIFTDLPAPASAGPLAAAASAAAPVPVAQWVAGGLRLMLKILWAFWLAVVGLNLVVWLAFTLANGDPVYFWPVWLAIPGVALFGVTLGVRRGVSALQDPRRQEQFRAARAALRAQRQASDERRRAIHQQRRAAFEQRRAAYDRRREAYDRRRAARYRYR